MIHINIGSNLDSSYGSKFDNISIAINLLIESKIKIKKISNFYETPSYPNHRLPKFFNIGILVSFDDNFQKLMRITKIIEKRTMIEPIRKLKVNCSSKNTMPIIVAKKT